MFLYKISNNFWLCQFNLYILFYNSFFLSFQAYAPELYLLEATPEVRQAIAASSEGSTRPQTRTSYDYDFAAAQRQSKCNTVKYIRLYCNHFSWRCCENIHRNIVAIDGLLKWFFSSVLFVHAEHTFFYNFKIKIVQYTVVT